MQSKCLREARRRQIFACCISPPHTHFSQVLEIWFSITPEIVLSYPYSPHGMKKEAWCEAAMGWVNSETNWIVIWLLLCAVPAISKISQKSRLLWGLRLNCSSCLWILQRSTSLQCFGKVCFPSAILLPFDYLWCRGKPQREIYIYEALEYSDLMKWGRPLPQENILGIKAPFALFVPGTRVNAEQTAEAKSK